MNEDNKELFDTYRTLKESKRDLRKVNTMLFIYKVIKASGISGIITSLIVFINALIVRHTNKLVTLFTYNGRKIGLFGLDLLQPQEIFDWDQIIIKSTTKNLVFNWITIDIWFAVLFLIIFIICAIREKQQLKAI